MIRTKLMRTLEDFEMKHKIIYFLAIIVITFVFTRVITFFNDPNIFLIDFELHHFYFGIILLIIVSILLIFSRKRHLIYLTLSAFSIGLILDEFIFVMGKIRSELSYSSTLFPTFFLILFICIAIFFISHYFSRKRKL